MVEVTQNQQKNSLTTEIWVTEGKIIHTERIPFTNSLSMSSRIGFFVKQIQNNP